MSDFDDNLMTYLKAKGRLEAIEPDYRLAFSALALHTSAARIYLLMGEEEKAKEELDKAANVIASVISAPRFIERFDDP